MRRRFKRLDLDIDVKFKTPVEKDFHCGKALNMSAIGLLVFSHKVYPIGDILDVSMCLEPIAPEVKMQAKVVWLVQKEIQPQLYPSMGLEFYHIDSPTQEKIVQFVERNMPLDSDVE